MMRRLRLHQELYSAPAVEEASAVFASHAKVCLREEKPYFDLEITAANAETDEDVLAGELANYVLALTVEEKRGASRGGL